MKYELYVPVTARCCPFCGSRNITVMSREFFNDLVAESVTGGAVIDVRCPDCNAVLAHYDHSVPQNNDYDSRLEIVMDKWNRRTIMYEEVRLA